MLKMKLLHHPVPNVIYRNRSDMPDRWRSIEESYPEYPSVRMIFPMNKYMEVVEFISTGTDAKSIHFDGDSVFIPAYYLELIDALEKQYSGTVAETDCMKEYEFTTLAIKAGVSGDLVAIGTAIFGLDGTAQEMMHKAVSSPAATLAEWKRLYHESMSSH